MHSQTYHSNLNTVAPTPYQWALNTMDDYSDYEAQSNREKWMNRFKWGAAVAGGIALAGCRIIRPNQLGLIEIFGKYHRTAKPGLRWMPPFGIGRMQRMPMDMRKVEIPGQSIITKEQLNAEVDAVAYYQVHDPVKAAYEVQDYANTVPTLAQTTLRNVLGRKTLGEANSNRQSINSDLKKELDTQINGWGMRVINVELQKIEPTARVQKSMNDIIVAEQKKIAATNLAHAAEIEADGLRRAAVKKAEGKAQSVRLEAEAGADAIRMKAKAAADALKMEYTAANTYFKGNAMFYQRLRTTENALKNNSTILMEKNSGTWNLLDIARMPNRMGEPCATKTSTVVETLADQAQKTMG